VDTEKKRGSQLAVGGTTKDGGSATETTPTEVKARGTNPIVWSISGGRSHAKIKTGPFTVAGTG